MITIETDKRRIPGPLPILASERYLKALSGDYGWFISPRFILPFYIEKQLFARVVVFTTGTIYRDPQTLVAEEQLFLGQVTDKARQLRADFIGQPRATALFRSFPENSIHIEFGSYRVDLAQGEPELFSRLEPRHRNVIRKAQRDGIVIQTGAELIPQCHELIQSTMARQHRAYVSLKQLHTYQQNLGSNIDFYLARHAGTNHGCAVLISDASSCYYILGGSRKPLHNGAMCLLHWTAMLEMKSKGVKTYDFVGGRVHPARGSKQESLQRFKSRFGSTFETGYLWKYPLNPQRYRLFRRLCLLRGMLSRYGPREDIIDNELRVSQISLREGEGLSSL